MIRVVPIDTAVTRPLASTVATSGWLLDHTTTAPGMIVLPVSFTSAVICTVSPTVVSVADGGLIVMLPASCITVTVALAVA